MDIQEVLNWTDEQVQAKTGKGLDSLQKAILEGVWQRQGYKDIADDCHCTTDHVRKMASELWKLLSDVLGEDVRKANVKAVVENGKFSQISNMHIGNGDINVCNENCPYPKGGKKRSTANPNKDKTEKQHDLTEAPKSHRLYNRTQELNLLKQWILEDNIPIVTVIGLSGIGKTALAVELIAQIKDNFDRILWRNCTDTPTLKSLKTHLIQFLSPNPQTKPPSLTDCLRLHRSLIVLDDFQELFSTGELAGTYLPEHENYGKFFQQISTLSHQSCLLLLSQEQPKITSGNNHCQILKLDGLGKSAAAILEGRNLTDEDKWLDLINLYSGNPLWLNIIADAVEDLCDGNIAQFLSCKNLYLGDL
ncbi:MAG: AAA family ATPase, partial [Okeania sp. SIO3I5]|uniref:NB-ARC domain-containing protein n=1 Tax=Okeania sp. SIO3I5 TaxID=2607805 RepID=UPI0013B9BB0B